VCPPAAVLTGAQYNEFLPKIQPQTVASLLLVLSSPARGCQPQVLPVFLTTLLTTATLSVDKNREACCKCEVIID